MASREAETEEIIFEAARRVFHLKGYAGARMQEIADEASINKSMLHYYFRSKKKLFQEVFEREMSRFFPLIFKVLNSDEALDEKIDQLIDTYYSFLRENPHLVQFVLYEMDQHPDQFQSFIEKRGIRPPKKFFGQIEGVIEEGRMDAVDPRQLMISIVGLILFPYIAGTMIKSVFSMDEEGYMNFLKERKKFLKSFILNGINYTRP
ncbi:MAG: TetR/AcrR family transcriptional regulator [Balneolaceae bacterium]|nr:TetR/AcrR family transcriptional regulator [Balneolaceae bacterium]